MQDELISIEKLKEIFAEASGERVIEVTEQEYGALLKEAREKNMEVTEESDHFILKLGTLSVRITCDYDEEEDEDEDDLE